MHSFEEYKEDMSFKMNLQDMAYTNDLIAKKTLKVSNKSDANSGSNMEFQSNKTLAKKKTIGKLDSNKQPEVKREIEMRAKNGQFVNNSFS